FATATVGTGKAITVTGYTLTGTASGNYSIGPLTGVTANITVKPLTLPDAAASNKPYDATAAATITGTLTGIIVPDVVTLTGTGTFASVNVGTGIAVTSTSTLGGAAAGNYSLTQPAGLTANITLKPLTITATGPAKFYGTALTAGSSTTNFTTTGIAGTESITSVTLRPNAAGLLAGTAAGAAYTVTPSLAIGAGGFLFSNYTVTYVDFAGTVSPKPITVTPNAGQRKLVGTANPVLTYTYAPALIGSDVFTGALSRATGETVAGSPYAITIGTLSAGTNYNLSLAPETFAITPASDAVLTAFNFTFLPNYPEVINQTGGTITVSVANSANVTTLVANFTVSPGATVRVGGVVQTSGVTPNNFTGVVNYVVTSNNGLFSKTYAVTVNKNAVVVEKQLLSFSFAAIPGATGVINQTNFTVTVPIPYSYNVTSLVATFTLSPMAQAKVGTVLQTSGVTANNFTAALTAPGFIFTIQSENGGTRNYYVSFVRDAARTEKQLLTFSLPGIGGADGAIDEVAHTVELTVPFAYVLTNRAATFTSSFVSTVWIGAAQQTSGVTTNDFTSALTYTVKAENVTSTQDYVVHVTKDLPATGKQLITFQFNGLAATANGVIDETAGTIAVTIPFSANKASLVATFTNSSLSTVKIGTNLQVSGTTPNNFTADVVYRVIAEDLTFKDYTVHVTQTPASILNQLLTFSVAALGGTVSGTINETTKSVLAEVPYGTNIADLVATFTVSQFATVKIGPVIGGAVQTSGVTHNNFTSPVAYRIIAEDGSSEIYTVVVRVFPAFVTFTFNDVATQPAGIINHTAHTITVHVPFSVDKSTLKAYFTVSGGATVSIDATAQTSGVTVNNFTAAKTYTLQVPGGSNSNYVVSVVSDPVRTGKQMLTFAFNGLTPACTGVINETAKTVTVNVPYATNVTNLVASFTLSELASAKVGTVAQASGVTPNNFTASVVYTVIAEDGLLQDYAVTVIVAIGSSAKDITYFAFEDLNPDVVGVITQTAPATITATVPNGTNRAALRAFYTASPLSTVRVLGDAGGIQQSGLTINDFRIPVVYQVAAQDGSLKTYTVTVGESADTTKPIVSNAIQTATNQTGQYVLLRSNEATGKVFIISTSVSQTTIAQLEAAVTAGYGRSAYVSAANADIPISTSNLPEGFYYAYAIDAAGNKSLRGTNLITVYDRIPPIVSVEAQTKSNSLTNVVNVRSSDASSLVYLILEGVPQLSKLQLDAAVTAKKGTVGLVQAAYVDVPLSVYGLLPGNYHAYAVDLSAYNNMSAPSPNVVVITEASRLKSILAFSFNELTPPAIGQIVLTDISVKLRVGTPVTALVATFTLSPLSTAYVGSIQQVSDVTPNDFTNPVVYKVIAENGTFFNYTVTVSFNTGIDESEWLNSIKSYPNPVSDRLTIEMTRPADRIQIINGLGQIMEDIHNPGQTTVEIQTSTWMKGIYFIRYYLDEQYIGIHKLIKD
ncbi:MAG: T9SS C-terminal target domain-containing protein, partial [Porphyromonadaceae bacterium]